MSDTPTARANSASGEAGSPTGFAAYLRVERTGGMILLGAALVALVIANSPLRATYEAVLAAELGASWLRLDVSHWISEGLLAVFFLVVGLEVKRELVVGELSRLRAALLPVAAALGGMIVPASIYLALNGSAGGGWAIPTATDIAFALGVLAVAGQHAPASLRILLLSLAVVDDLGAIAIIAVVFADGVGLSWLLGACVLVGTWIATQRTQWHGGVLVAVGTTLGIGTWICVHEAGLHATIAGVVMGLATRVRRRAGEERAPAERAEHAIGPWSAGIVVPLYALSAAGVALSTEALDGLREPVGLGILLGLVAGKLIGITLGCWLAVRTGIGVLGAGVGWGDVAAVGLLGGCGFTVSLLIAGLALEGEAVEGATLSVLGASVLAGALGAALLRWRRAAHQGADA